MKYSRLHARCGTNYLFLVMAVSILFFAMLPYAENLFLRVLTRLVFLPLVAGLAYEVLKLAAASDALWARIMKDRALAAPRAERSLRLREAAEATATKLRKARRSRRMADVQELIHIFLLWVRYEACLCQIAAGHADCRLRDS